MPVVPPQVTRALGLALLALATLGASRRPPLPAGPGGDCAQCHLGQYGGFKVVHAPVKSGLCGACHVSSSATQHTFDLLEEGKSLCTQCHSGRAFLKVKHLPVEQGLCLGCHDPHASDHHARLRKPIFETCTTCHPTKRLQDAAAVTKHGALDPKQNPKVCVACHDAHQSDYPKRLLAWPPSQVCFGCHDRRVQAGETSLIDMKGWVDAHPDAGMRHGPVQEGQCPACHEPHGTDNFRILKGSYPQALYVPFSPKEFGLCFGCHDRRLVEQSPLPAGPPSPAPPAWAGPDGGQRLTRDGVTGFRNGDENLHVRHVNKIDKGRTCRLCHDVHASDQPHHLREATPFGAWEFSLQYEPTATGGSCWPGCHVRRYYDRTEKRENPR